MGSLMIFPGMSVRSCHRQCACIMPVLCYLGCKLLPTDQLRCACSPRKGAQLYSILNCEYGATANRHAHTDTSCTSSCRKCWAASGLSRHSTDMSRRAVRRTRSGHAGSPAIASASLTAHRAPQVVHSMGLLLQALCMWCSPYSISLMSPQLSRNCSTWAGPSHAWNSCMWREAQLSDQACVLRLAISADCIVSHDTQVSQHNSVTAQQCHNTSVLSSMLMVL